MNEITEKRCCCCKTVKPVTDFCRNKQSKKDGYNFLCKLCDNIAKKRRRVSILFNSKKAERYKPDPFNKFQFYQDKLNYFKDLLFYSDNIETKFEREYFTGRITRLEQKLRN